MATTTLDNVISESGSRFGIGAAAEPLVRELLKVMTGGPGGLTAFLERFRSAGLSNEVASFVGGQNETPLAPQTVDTVMGETTVAGIARRVGLAPAAAAGAMGFAIPKVIALLTPGGRVPTAIPSDIQSFVGEGERVGPVAPTVAAVRGAEPVAPMAAAAVREGGRNFLWLFALIGLVLLALLLWLALGNRRPAPPVAAVVPPIVAPGPIAVPTPPAPTVAAVEALNHDLSDAVLNFATGSAVLPEASRPVLQEAATKIEALPAGTVIEIGGHTDNTGAADANVALSQQRADAVRNALIQDGVKPEMLTAKGYGPNKPADSNDTAQGRLANRRTEFTIVGSTVTTNPPAGPATTAPSGN
jgi:outer membrane protein OmpA-like peptidoglycan-associated protein/uncharacterized protein YidB (DUF937 family)